MKAAKYVPKAVGLLFLYTGFSKLFWPGEATLALETVGVSKSLASAAVILALVAELYLGALLVTGIDRRYATAASIALLFMFTGYLFYLSTLAHPPSCGCLGLTGIFKSSKQAAVFGVLRNCIILWALKFSYDSRRLSAPDANVLSPAFSPI